MPLSVSMLNEAYAQYLRSFWQPAAWDASTPCGRLPDVCDDADYCETFDYHCENAHD